MANVCNDYNGVFPANYMAWENGITQLFLPYLQYSKVCNERIPSGTAANPTALGVCWHPLNTIKQLDGTVLSMGNYYSFNGLMPMPVLFLMMGVYG